MRSAASRAIRADHRTFENWVALVALPHGQV